MPKKQKNGLSSKPVDKAFVSYSAMPMHNFPMRPDQQRATDFNAGWYACLEYIQQVEHITRAQLQRRGQVASGGTG